MNRASRGPDSPATARALPAGDGAGPVGPSDAARVLGPTLGATPWVTAAVVVVGLLGFANRYGFHRDELYFRIAGQHLALGYVDQPPFTPFIARVQEVLFGDSPWALRVWPALVAGAVVLLGASLCREFGGGRRAQGVAAVAIAASPGLLLAGHTLSTEVTDLLIWQVIGLLAVRALRTNQLGLWVAVGATVGVGLQNKDLPLFLALTLVAGLVLSRRWDVLTSRWFWLGAAVALLVAAPALAWQATHGFPQWSVAQAQRNGTGVAKYILLQLIVLNPVLIPAQVRGVRKLWSEARYRPLVWAFALLEVFFLLTGGKPYYPAAILLLLAAAGLAGVPGLRDESIPGAHLRRARLRVSARYALIAGFGLLLVPAVLPVLPEATFARSPFVAEDDARATIGWPQLAAQVDVVAARLPTNRAAHAVILTSDYGEAGALERFGTVHLPIVSGHNSLWYYGRPLDTGTTAVVVGYPMSQATRWFNTCSTSGLLHTPYGLDNQENGVEVLVCSGPSQSWRTLWPELRHND